MSEPEWDIPLCQTCDDKGWFEDPLSNAMGGCWFRYCMCPAGDRAYQEDQAAKKLKKISWVEMGNSWQMCFDDLNYYWGA